MMTRRSTGKTRVARAIWYPRKGVAELRAAPLPRPQPGQALVRTLFSGISRGTERLVFHGAVGQGEWESMRGPNQEGAFSFPIKYGYCATGVVEDGPAALLGRTVFCLHPHQDYFVAKIEELLPVPGNVPAQRATLAANMETALNAVWDASAGPADRIVVVGAGVVGLLVGYLAARFPAADVTVVDVDETRASIAATLKAKFSRPEKAPMDADIVFHASASESGLATAMNCAGFEGTVVEMSWYGSKPVQAPLGGAFHSRRLRLVASQVGHVAASRRPRWSHRRRAEAAIGLLCDSALDALVADEIAFEDAPRELPRVFARGALGLAPVIRYPQI